MTSIGHVKLAFQC